MHTSDLAAPTESADPLRLLMARVALRDRAAFERLYRATSSHLYSIALRVLRDEGRADEVLQEAYVSVWQKAGSYQSDAATPMTWMINIVRNRAIDALRAGRHQRDTTVELNDEAMDVAAEAAGEPQALFDASLVKAHLDDCMLGLPPAQRQALALAYYRGMVHTEIAEMLHTPLGTIKSWVRRGLEQLKSCLDRAGVRQ
ncbi:sigma-70 family RNA polymerase sigma factor [Roseateles amylovorans]|uniref:Sigma-70 family RNA polymerase sigma factor n=1 Tax=Roseateles amylovorans TaxID=2978473 RepID=A0ABY6ATQ6_9BURK|nr:sigma-70 family RNA polymerase sigma factor [Roseateles amylovorans]UXH76165.1 sigma-70 family RNA polymerase sigma factor [Roseateles amylovorans]